MGNMKNSRMRFVIFVIAAVFIPLAPARAVPMLSVLDDTVHGIGSITRDDITGLEWLDLTRSVGRSFNDLTGVDGTDEFITGGDFAGFRYATADEVFSLYQNGADFPDLPPITGGVGPLTDANNNEAATLIVLLGATICPSGCSAFALNQRIAGGRLGVVTNGANPHSFVQLTLTTSLGRIVHLNSALDVDNPAPGWGSWMVRDSQSVPEPETLALLGLGLALIGFGRRSATR